MILIYSGKTTKIRKTKKWIVNNKLNKNKQSKIKLRKRNTKRKLKKRNAKKQAKKLSCHLRSPPSDLKDISVMIYQYLIL